MVYIIILRCGFDYVHSFTFCPLECSLADQKPKKDRITQQVRITGRMDRCMTDCHPWITEKHPSCNGSIPQCISNMFNEYKPSFALLISAWARINLELEDNTTESVVWQKMTQGQETTEKRKGYGNENMEKNLELCDYIHGGYPTKQWRTWHLFLCQVQCNLDGVLYTWSTRNRKYGQSFKVLWL